MKQILQLTLFTLLFITSVKAQIPNSGFELLNIDTSLQNWRFTGTIAVSIGDSIITDGPMVSASTQSRTGMYAMELRNSYNYTQNQLHTFGSASCTLPDTISYMGFTKKIPLSIQPITFDFYYHMYQNPHADSTVAIAKILNSAGNEIGEAKTTVWDIDNIYKHKSTGVNYHTSSADYLTDSIPAFAEISFANKPNTLAQGNIGQRVLIDDVSFNQTPLANTDIFLTPNITIYPNPTPNKLYIKKDNIIKSYSIRLLDYQGREILSSKNISDATYFLDLGELSEGIYFLEITDGAHKQQSKIIKY